MHLAARGCFENRPYRQVQNSVRRVHGQQVEREGEWTTEHGLWVLSK